ncbi:hypothetical protein LTR62_007642 [Meristemomyces frigidus]|uniref:LYC1 C-terminal domain-containing protein n=1 Tax=Meristemomyces frigidus TaxID=1508187 RepID=A0AAN7YDI9_9PEZI|nr:hypothetical protein LTR62_007642 [Meristemomyces frigidus]
MELPHKDSPNLHLVVATQEELLQQQNDNSGEWKGALSLEAYLRREEVLLQLDLTKDGGLTPWMLVHQPPNAVRTVLCGCESLKKKALVAKDGKVRDVVAHGVASVFCPPKYRGKGYAGVMMSKVAQRLQKWQVGDGNAEFSILFSDIGKEFYTARGWQPFPSCHVSLPAKAELGEGLATSKVESGDYEELCADDQQLLRKRLQAMSSSGRTAVALLPDVTTLHWHQAREDFVARELHSGNANVMAGGRGAMVKMDDGFRAWCYWTRVWTNPQEEAPNTLHILRVVVEGEGHYDFGPASEDGLKKVQNTSAVKAVSALFQAAQLAAHQAGMNEVQIWNPTSTTLAAVKLLDANSATVEREKESITSLLWYGEGSWEDVDWVCNEKYGWC